MIEDQEIPSFVKKLQAKGIADSRAQALKYGVERIHAGICEMDSSNRIAFEKHYGGRGGIYKLLYDFSECEVGLRNIYPVLEE